MFTSLPGRPLLQGVTLGGTGKEHGDRHPKIGQGALLGAGATILGNITVGEGAMIAAGSLVLKHVPPHRLERSYCWFIFLHDNAAIIICRDDPFFVLAMRFPSKESKQKECMIWMLLFSVGYCICLLIDTFPTKECALGYFFLWSSGFPSSTLT